MTYLFFDTETTGLPMNWNAPVTDLNNWPRVVQVAWLQYDDSEDVISSKDYIIKPKGFSIPEESTQIHGITTERAVREGAILGEVLTEFSMLLDDSTTLIAHNISFDTKVMEAEFLRKNISNNIPQIPKICTMKSSTDFCEFPRVRGYGYKYPTLSELYYKLFRTGFEEAHNAAKDVEVCADCFFELKRRGIIR